jgi:hypothetical protein
LSQVLFSLSETAVKPEDLSERITGGHTGPAFDDYPFQLPFFENSAKKSSKNKITGSMIIFPVIQFKKQSR